MKKAGPGGESLSWPCHKHTLSWWQTPGGQGQKGSQTSYLPDSGIMAAMSPQILCVSERLAQLIL